MSAFAQTLISCDLIDIVDMHMVEQEDINPNLVHFSAYLNNELVWADASEEASGSLFWVYVPGNIIFDEWDVFIDPAPDWLDFPLEPNPSDLRDSNTHFFHWWINDTRP